MLNWSHEAYSESDMYAIDIFSFLPIYDLIYIYIIHRFRDYVPCFDQMNPSSIFL